MNIIEILKIFYGMNTKEAKEYNKKIDDKMRIQLKNMYEQSAKKAFYED